MENKPCERLCKYIRCAYGNCYYCEKYKEELEWIDDETFFRLEKCLEAINE